MIAFTLALGYSGFVALYLGVAKHFRDVFCRESNPGLQRILRAIGGALLGGSFVAAVAGAGWQAGPVLWFAATSLAATALVFLLPYVRRGLLVAPLWLLPATALLALW